jgi:large subunit ribosomal protein L24
MSLSIKKGDNVIVLSGKDRDKKGRVIAILTKKG